LLRCRSSLPGTSRQSDTLWWMSLPEAKGEVLGWRLLPSVGHALAAGMNPRPEPPLVGVSAHSDNDRCRENRHDDSLFLPGPRFCPESALGHAP
jgi:hypothetical protein